MVKHADRCKHVLGLVIPEIAQYSPFDVCGPYWADEGLNVEMKIGDKSVPKKKVLRDAIEKLWTFKLDYGGDEPTDQSSEDTAVQLNVILTGNIAAKNQGMPTTITKLFDMITLKDKLEGVAIESGSVKCYKIDNRGAKLQDTLLPCIPWKQQLKKLFDKDT